MARAVCLMLFWHWARAAASRTFCTAGNNRPIRMAMMAITTNNSIRVNARRRTRMAALLSKDGWGENEIKIRPLAPGPPGPALRYVEIELVRPFRLDFDNQLRLQVVLGRNALLAPGSGRPRPGRLDLLTARGAVPANDRDLVAAGQQPFVPGN